MAHNPNNKTIQLADQAIALSKELSTVKESCRRETTAEEILSIADELAKLSTTLQNLNDAITSDPHQYTAAFQQDLQEITNELTEVFAEISECCAGLQMADSRLSSVSWFFRKGRVTRLLKHLETLKGTLLVMRTVLWHGKDYGTHKSDRLAETSPHTMHEDRVILESILATNRDAIRELHALTDSFGDTGKRNLERKLSKARDHHRELSESIGVDVPPMQDVLPVVSTERRDPHSKSSQTPAAIQRTFSKRGMRLGVHMSILDLSAHDAPNNLKKKWIHQARHRQLADNDRRGLTALPELSRISEVDTAAGSTTNLHALANVGPTASDAVISPIPGDTSARTPSHAPSVPHNTPADMTPVTSNINAPLGTSRGSDNRTIGGKLRRAMSKLSMSNLRSPLRARILTNKGSSRGSGEVDRSDKSNAADGNEAKHNVETPGKFQDILSGAGIVRVRTPFLQRLKQNWKIERS